VLSVGARDERRRFTRLFVKETELEPDTGDILMHLFGRPPVPSSVQTPTSKETGVRIALVAVARYVAIHDVVGQVRFRYSFLPLPPTERRKALKTGRPGPVLGIGLGLDFLLIIR